MGPVSVLRVLLIDDNPADAWLAGEALRQAGYVASVKPVRDGAEALDLLLEYTGRGVVPHDLIILDLNLPRIAGGRLLKEFSSGILRDTPLLVTSSTIDPATAASVESLPRAVYLQKPANLGELTELSSTIRNLLELR